jgi:hypothetical protein
MTCGCFLSIHKQVTTSKKNFKLKVFYSINKWYLFLGASFEHQVGQWGGAFWFGREKLLKRVSFDQNRAKNNLFCRKKCVFAQNISLVDK